MNDDNINVNILYDKFQMIAAITSFENQELNKRLNIESKSPNFSLNKKVGFEIMKKKIIAFFISIIVLTSGIVFAKDIKRFVENTFGLGEGIDTAVENGYIQNVDMDYKKADNSKVSIVSDDGTIINDLNTKMKVNDFFIDDYNLSLDFEIKINKKIVDYLGDIDENANISLPDLIVGDNESNILFEKVTKNRFESYKGENNINLNYQDYNEKYMNSGVNYFLNSVTIDGDDVILSLKYNMYTSNNYPNSKSLNIDLNKIRFEKDEKIYTSVGNYNFKLYIPEKMQNRTYEYYKVVSTSNNNFNVYTARLSDTGFELGLTISNVEKAKYPENLKIKDEKWQEEHKDGTYYDMNGNYCVGIPVANSLDEFIWLYGSDEYFDEYKEYMKNLSVINVTSGTEKMFENENLETKDGSYIISSDNIKYTCTMNPGRKCNSNFINGEENKFDFYETFGMTKANATHKIKVVLSYRYVPVVIELEKIN